MTTIPLMTVLLLTLAGANPAGAQIGTPIADTGTTPVIAAPPTAEVSDAVMTQVAYLQNTWADIKYGQGGKEQKLAALDTLEKEAAALVAQNPARAEPMIWDAIILSTQAGIIKGISALPKVKQAKALLEGALRLDAGALDGSAHTSLGSLYYQVPGWPVGFGDAQKAEQHLKAALALNPDGIDPNYFYGDFLIKQERYSDAVAVLQHAQAALPREGRAVADAGRQQEIAEALGRAQDGLAKGKKSAFN